MTTLTAEQTQAIAETVTRMHLPEGIGTAEAACSIAAINLALTGTLTDDIPECMSEVIGRWVIITQDRMSDEARNSAAWKALLPLAAGTGREREQERLAIALDAMWEALAWVQPTADRHGFGGAWTTMTLKRTAAAYAADTAYAAYAAAVDAAVSRAQYDAWAVATLDRLVAA